MTSPMGLVSPCRRCGYANATAWAACLVCGRDLTPAAQPGAPGDPAPASAPSALATRIVPALTAGAVGWALTAAPEDQRVPALTAAAALAALTLAGLAPPAASPSPRSASATGAGAGARPRPVVSDDELVAALLAW